MSSQIITKPQTGETMNVEPMIGETTSLNFTLEEVHNFRMTPEGLEIKMDDGSIVMITNFETMAKSGEATPMIMADGTEINPETLFIALNSGASTPSEAMMETAIVISQPDMNITREIKMQPGQKFQFDFDPHQAESIEMQDGEMIITFETNGTLILRGFDDVKAGQLPPEMSLADGRVIDVDGLLTTVQMALAEKEGVMEDDQTQYANDHISPEALEEMLAIQPAAGDEIQGETSSYPFQEIAESEATNMPAAMDLEGLRHDGLAVGNQHQMRDDSSDMAAQAQELAEIETAAGGNTGGASRGGFGFESQVDDVRLDALNAIGPIIETALQYKAPEFNEDPYLPEDDNEILPPGTPGAEFESLIVKEDSSVDMLFNVVGNSTSGVETEIVISNIPTGWTMTSAQGTFDAVTGTWTFTMLGNETLSEILTFAPPAESDIDLTGALITITNTDLATGLSSQFNGTFNIDVDAVADVPTIDALDSTGNEGEELPVDIFEALGTDNFDGSEEITSVTIENVPTEITFTNGVYTIDPSGTTATWTFTTAELAGLRAAHTDVNFVGSVTLSATVHTEEANLSGVEFDTSDNTNSATDEFTLTWKPVVNPPEVSATVNAPDSVIDEDTSVTVDINANLDPNGSGNEILTVTVDGLDPSWNIVPPAGGAFNPAGTSWTITLPANTDFSGVFTFTPPAESDVDLTGMTVTATAFEPATSTSSDASDNFDIIVDAVADKPDVDADDNSGKEGETLDVNISGQLGTDNFDGSESITAYRISGVPAGFTLSAGTATAVAGEYELTPAELAGLTITPPANFVGSIDLIATVLTAETNTSDVEPDLSDNTNSDSEEFTLTWKPVVNPPEVSATVNAPDSVIDEDTSVTVDINANLDPNGSGNEVLTVTVDGLDPSWNIVPPAGGAFNPAGTSWTITLPANTDFSGVFTFTPPAESDVDLTGMTVTATAFEPATSTSSDATDNFDIIVDAVADAPTITTQDDSGSEGETLDIDFQGFLGSDNFDGSESITAYRISGVPAGFTINGSMTDLGGGVYEIMPGDIANLTITPIDPNFNGSITLDITVLTAETNTSDVEPDLSDNTNSATEELTLTWTVDAEPPTLEAGHYCIYEDGQELDGVGTPTGVTFDMSASLPATATSSAYLTITMTGIDTAWALTDAAGGTYNAATGTWSITLAAGADFTGGPSFFPPEDSDVDMTGIIVTATTTEPSTGATASTTDETHVLVDAVADTPDVAANNVSGEEEQWIDLDVSAALNDIDGTETLEIIISGVPADAELSHGTQQGAGIYSIPVSDLSSLQIRTAPGFEGVFELTVTAIATETDKTENPDTDFNFLNDTAENSVKFTVTVDGDDTPTIIKPEAQTVDDTDLEFGNDVVSGTLNANFYGDGPGTFATNNSFTFGGSVQNGVLTSGGVAVTVSQTAAGYVGTAGGETIFTLDLNTNTGAYTFTLVKPLDHADTSNDNEAMNLYFGVEASDNDGDKADTVITIKVLDDGLTAEDDTNEVDVATGVATGNVTDNDDFSQDTPNTVTKVTFGSDEVSVPTAGTTIIDGTYGQLEISADGSYTYTLFDTDNGNGASTATFTPTEAHAAGQQDTIVLNGITVQAVGYSPFDITWYDGDAGKGIGILNLGDPNQSVKMYPLGEEFLITPEKAASQMLITVSDLGSNDNDGQHGCEVLVTLEDGSTELVEIQFVSSEIDNGYFSFELSSDNFGGQLITSAKLFSVDDGQFDGASMLLNEVTVTYPEDCGCNKDVFEYTLTDADGDTDTATITFDCVESVIIVGKNVHDVDPSTTEYTVGEGSGTITGQAGADILIGDTGGSESVPQVQDYNFAFILDVSGSMGSNTDASSRIYKLIEAVKLQVNDYKEYVENGNGEVNVAIIPFASRSTQSYTVNLSDADAIDNLIHYIESLQGSGYTNYEAGLQNAIDVINGLPANASAELVTYFITDGEPNYYLDDNGNVVVNSSANTAMNQILGIDGTDEIEQIQQLSSEVIGVGISVGATALERIGRIDSDGNPVNIQDADDLSPALQALDPISNFDSVGDDEIIGNAGDDTIFGDVLYTDFLAAQHGLSTKSGAGWKVFEQLEAGESALNPDWTREDTISYIQDNAASLAQESVGTYGETRDGGNDMIFGGNGNDVIFGQEGNDIIAGQAGNDNLYGGSGADVFLFESITDGLDTIHDFDASEGDVIKLDGILESFDSVTDAINDFVFTTEVGGNTIISVDANGSGDINNATELAKLEGVTGLSVSDLFDDNNLEVA